MINLEVYYEDLIYNDLSTYLESLERDEQTIKMYCSDGDQFLQYIKPNNLSEINKVAIDKYKNYLLLELNLHPKTVNRKLVAVKHMSNMNELSWIIKQEKIHMQNYLDDLLTESEVNSIIQCARDSGEMRAVALIETLKVTGMRISEALQLKVEHIDSPQIIVIGKGRKQGEIFVTDRLRDVWREYLQTRIDKTSFLFTTRKGNMHRNTALKIFKKYGQLAGIDPKKVYCHNLRHYTAKTLIDAGVPIDVVSSILRHSSLDTTAIYTRASKKEILDVMERSLG